MVKRLVVFALLFLSIVLHAPDVAFAVPAAPIVHELTQDDGSTFRARQWGDESRHGWETEDGHAIVHDSATRSWRYAETGPDGVLRGTKHRVGKENPPSQSHRARPSIAVPKREMEREGRITQQRQLSQSQSASAAGGATLVVPPTGTGKLPVILINFIDTGVTFSAVNFQSLLFGTGTNSMKDYYQEVSKNIFSVDGVVLGWYAASSTKAYYGQPTAGDIDGYVGTLVREAVAAVDTGAFNWAAYDLDGDCYVDAVAVIHSGRGQEESGVANDIWSHRWNLNSAYYYGQSNAGEYTTKTPCSKGGFIKINDYIMMPEKLGPFMSTIGVFAHEYGHSLGLPDLYDTDYSSEGVGEWSLMASGSWTYVTVPGDRPAHFDPWSKYWLGWITPELITGTTQRSMAPRTVYQLLSGTPTSGEYFLAENRQKTGFDAGLPGSGLLVWHVDTAKADNTNECVPTTATYCTTAHYKVALVQADGNFDLEKGVNRGDGGDPYPGAVGKTAINHASVPNSRTYNIYSTGGVQISGITQTGNNIDALFSAENRVSVIVEGNGTVTGANINCSSAWTSANCTSVAPTGSIVNLTAVPAPGAVFAGWLGACSVNSTNCSFVLSNGKTAIAQFAPTSLSAALDGSLTNAWISQSHPWRAVADSTAVGGFSAKSGAIDPGEISGIENTVQGPGLLTFRWRVSSQQNCGTLYFTVGGATPASISGSTSWATVSYQIPSGSHNVWWPYQKCWGTPNTAGEDAAWLDNVVFFPEGASFTTGQKVGMFVYGDVLLDVNGDGTYTQGVDKWFGYGSPGDIVVYGDWNGDGKTKIGVFNNGSWRLDYKGTGVFVGCGAPADPTKDLCATYGGVGDIPIVGDWNGDGKTKIGVYRGGYWYLDYSGKGAWVGCGAPANPARDTCTLYGAATDYPVVGDWNGDGRTKIGVYRGGYWYLDYSGKHAWVGCGAPADPTKDTCSFYGAATDYPVIGDWNGDGKTKIGVYRGGYWYLDYSGKHAWVGCGAPADPTKDTCSFYGATTDYPIVGDWNGDGRTKIGVFRGGNWYLDYSGKHAWVGCGAPTDSTKDTCYSFGWNGGTPIVGKW